MKGVLNPNNNNTLVNNILECFENFRMRTKLPNDEYLSTGKKILFDKISEQINNDQQLTFVMLGLPFKSTNTRDKVLGVEPDMAEEVTFEQMKRFNENISKVYSKGIKIKIVSDGFVFNDLLEVQDHTVWDYKHICEDMIDQIGAPIEVLDVTSFYGGNNLRSIRQKIVTHFEVTDKQLTEKILFDTDTNLLYKGMIRFMGQELAMKNYDSNNQLHKAAKKLARAMMLRNESYSNLVKKEFSKDIRLSMHPSVNNGAKYSFQMINSDNAHHSAWHSAVVLNEDNSVHSTIHKKDGLSNTNMDLVSIGGVDSHFINLSN